MKERRKQISLLVPDIGSPIVGAALKLAHYLREAYEVQLVGPDFGSGVCSMYRDAAHYTVIPAGRLYRYPDYWWECRRLAAAVTGDVIIALKAYANTVPVALSLKKRRDCRVMVYLDEWDGALWHTLSPRDKIRTVLQHGHHPLESCYHARVERMIPQADQVLSTTTFLQKKFGGQVLHAGVDTDRFQPQPSVAVERLRVELGLAGKRIIVFGGVVRPHKGVEEIVGALERIGDDRNRLLIAGPLTDHLEALRGTPAGSQYICVAGTKMHDTEGVNAKVHAAMPLYLDLGHLVVLPLRDTPLAQSQMPIKIFEAMAMAKPIIASAVSDLPEILAGCGIVVPPGDPVALATAIQSILDDPQRAQALGESAREKCIREYGQPVMRQALLRVVERVMR